MFHLVQLRQWHCGITCTKENTSIDIVAHKREDAFSLDPVSVVASFCPSANLDTNQVRL